VQEEIKAYFVESVQTQIAASETIATDMVNAAVKLVQALLDGGKILCCGNGASAANIQNFVAKLMNQFEIERPSLPAIALLSNEIMNSSFTANNTSEDIYTKQINALASNGDIMLAVSVHGDDKSIIKAIETAVRRDMSIIALTGGDGGEISGLLGSDDVEIRVPSYRHVRIEELHHMVLNCLCNLIDCSLFPSTNQ